MRCYLISFQKQYFRVNRMSRYTVVHTYIELSLFEKSRSLKWISFPLQKWKSFLYKNTRLNWNRLYWNTLLILSDFQVRWTQITVYINCFYNGYIAVPDCDARTRVTNYIKVLAQVVFFFFYTGEFMSMDL
jgi:hypothetical protein